MFTTEGVASTRNLTFTDVLEAKRILDVSTLDCLKHKVSCKLFIEDGHAFSIGDTLLMSYPDWILINSKLGNLDYAFEVLEKYIKIKYC